MTPPTPISPNMTQATSSNTNLQATTPIRTGHSQGGMQQGPETTASSSNNMQQYSSSVPSSGMTQPHTPSHLQLQSNNQIGASNQSSVGGGAVVGGSSSTPPSSAGLRQAAHVENKLFRRTSLQMPKLPKLSSTDSLSNSPSPSSPGIANWASENREKIDVNQGDKTPTDSSKLNRKESYKAQRKNYRREKKRVASELLNSLQDPAVIVLADWLKVRGTLKSWTKLWCVLKPGLLLIYKSPKTKSSHWVGTVLLTSCQVIERPSKKDGFCFKLFHPLEQSIWAPRGPDKETIGAVVQPLPTAYLIFRAPSQAAGKCWMDALELSLRCSALLLRSTSNSGAMQGATANADVSGQISHETQWSEADYEKHFNEHEQQLLAPGIIGEMLKSRHSHHLTVPEAKSLGSSYTNLSSRPQTPLLQQLYLTMTNWEHMVTNTSEFKRVKNFRKHHKLMRADKKDTYSEGVSSTADLSDVSSVEFSPRKSNTFGVDKGATSANGVTQHTSLKMKERRLSSLPKSLSMGSVLNTSSSSDDCDDEDVVNMVHPLMADFRNLPPLRNNSAPPEVKQHFLLTVKDLDADSQTEAAAVAISGPESDSDSDMIESVEPPPADEPETPYMPKIEEDFYVNRGEQIEELGEENKSLIWCLVKQVRPGMDLSKVVLPTFILEPRSFLDKLSDSYYHADILSKAVAVDDPFTRMKLVVEWYLSGFYKKPKGLKKPYNPILGETFRCYWEHPNGSRTFYIAEQVSHHPPISAFYVTNRQDGFCISCSILAKSKFYGNSTSAVLEGAATLTLLPRGESYTLSTPYAHCKGILMGTLSMELGGKIDIVCENTGYKTEIEFKLKPFLGGAESTNIVSGKIKLGKETMAIISGHWDSEMLIKDAKTAEESVLFSVNKETKEKRLIRYLVPIESQLPNESERLWQRVSAAILGDDQVGATEEKTELEEQQRISARQRESSLRDWNSVHFQHDPGTGQWIYKYADLRPWDPRTDVRQYESNYKVLTKTRHVAPLVRSTSMARVDSTRSLRSVSSRRSKGIKHNKSKVSLNVNNSDSSPTNDDEDNLTKKTVSDRDIRKLAAVIEQVRKALDEHTEHLKLIHSKLERIQYAPSLYPSSLPSQPYISAHSTRTSQSLLFNVVPRSIPQSTAIKWVTYILIGLVLSITIKWWILQE